MIECFIDLSGVYGWDCVIVVNNFICMDCSCVIKDYKVN